MVEEGGNTISPSTLKKKRISASKMWCFTLNNYEDSQMVEMVELFKVLGADYVIGREVGEKGTPHLQGYIRRKTCFRPIEACGTLAFAKRIHWEKCKGNHEQNVAYCTKEGSFETNLKLPAPIKVVEPTGWQLHAIEAVSGEPDDRTIHWYWEADGGVGKSSLMRYLVHKRGALVCSGKAADMKYLVVKYKEEHEGICPELIVFDVPRSSHQYLSYTGIEEIKNGCFASTKYECGMHIQNHPHVLVFANFAPTPGLDMSADRFRVFNIREELM